MAASSSQPQVQSDLHESAGKFGQPRDALRRFRTYTARFPLSFGVFAPSNNLIIIPAIKIDQVHKYFGAVHALKGVDLTIEQGEFFALLGPNGAGKSTLINLIAGLLRPTSGKLAVMGFDVLGQYRQARHALGMVPQELVFDPFFNVREMLRFQAGYFGHGPENDAWVDEILEGLGLADKAHTNMRKLSGGMK